MDDLTQPETSQPADDAISPHLRREYWCFISYRHADNKEPGRQWATWLHQALETYEVPADLVGTKNARGDVIPERIFPVFRDEEELPADARLSTPIEAALQGSRFLVVLCSPKAVKSEFVAGEILRFKQLGKQDRILAAILEGEPTGGADLTRECFPKPLRFAVDEQGRLTDELAEPIAADFRLPDGTPGWTSPAAFREALKAAGVPEKAAAAQVSSYMQQQNLMLLKIVAGVLGVPLGVLTQRDKAYQLQKQQQRAKVLRRWLAAVAMLALAALIAGVLAVQNARELSDTLGIAYFREGSSRLKNHRTAREGLAYLARAVREHAHTTAARRLLTFMQQREVWTLDDAGAAPVPEEEKQTEKPVVPAFVKAPPFKEEPGKFDLVVQGPKGLTAVSWCEDLESAEGSGHAGSGLHHFRVWDAAGKPLCDWLKADAEADHWIGNIHSMTFSPDGQWLAVTVERWRQPEYLQLWDIGRGVQIGETIEATGQDPNYQGAGFMKVSFTSVKREGDVQRCALLTGSSRGDACWLEIMRPADPAETIVIEKAVVPHAAAIRAVFLRQTGKEVFVTASEDAEVWFTQERRNKQVADTPVLRLDQPVDVIREAGDGSGVMLHAGGRQYHAQPTSPLVLASAMTPGPGVFASIEEDDHLVRVARDAEDGQPLFQRRFEEKIVRAHAQEQPLSLSVETEDGTVRAFVIEKEGARLIATGHGSEVTLETQAGVVTVSLRGLVTDLWPAAEGRSLVTVTRSHAYQLWDAATGAPLSKPLEESIFFRQDQVPDETDRVLLSPDQKTLLTRSQHWEPPNAMFTWTMLWDAATGEPLSDRIGFIDDGFDESGATQPPFLNDQTAGVEGPLRHHVAPEHALLLADLAEAMACLRLDSTGELQALKTSKERLAELKQKLVERMR